MNFARNVEWDLFCVFSNSVLYDKKIISSILINVSVRGKCNWARFARNVEWDLFCDFQTLWRRRLIGWEIWYKKRLSSSYFNLISGGKAPEKAIMTDVCETFQCFCNIFILRNSITKVRLFASRITMAYFFPKDDRQRIPRDAIFKIGEFQTKRDSKQVWVIDREIKSIRLWLSNAVFYHGQSSNSYDHSRYSHGHSYKNASFAHCLKITEKVSFNIASYVYILSGQKLVKNAHNGQFWRGFEKLRLAVKQCYTTGQI